jgi:opacity protein-like surface antigen
MTAHHATSRNHFVAIAFVTALAFSVHASAAGQTEASGDAWQFELTPYLFGAGLNGTTGISTGLGNVTTDIDMSFGDVLDNFDSGFMMMFEARKDQWSFGIDGVYFKLKNEAAKSWTGPLGNSGTGTLQATMTQQIYQPYAAYRLLNGRDKLDLLGAARYTQLDTDLNLVTTTGSPLLPDGSRSISPSENWWDPVIGVRLLTPFTEEWAFVGYADIGGFGVGSDFTYQLLAGLNWQFSKSVSAKAGYRYFYQDYEQDGFIWDMAASGFYLGAGFRF